MRLYDEIVQEILRLTEKYEAKRFPVDLDETWKDLGNNNMVLRSEMAYELGGKGMPAIGCTAITADEAFVPQDEIILLGRDIGEIDRDLPYARIALVRVAEDSLGEGNTLYNAIRKIEYTRYHVNPEGFMMRVSAINKRETARVDKKAKERGLNFQKIGNVMMQSFHENPKIQAAKLIFINLEDFPYAQLTEYATQAEKITKTIDHMMKNIVMDCDVCNLKEVCDEVEGMKELHFGAASKQ